MVRRKARPAPVLTTADLAIPDALLAGACLEVWTTARDAEHGPFHQHMRALRRWQHARDRWLVEHGIDPEDHHRRPIPLRDGGHRHPWSWTCLAAHDPAALAEQLTCLGLPANWRPLRCPDNQVSREARRMRLRARRRERLVVNGRASEGPSRARVVTALLARGTSRG